MTDNDAWLSQAHMLCTDLGIAQGNIEDRLFEAMGKVHMLIEVDAAARNLCAVKGRHHSEIAMRKLMDACGRGDKP